MPSLTQAHAALAATSLLGFLVRGVWMMRGSPLLGRPWVKITPHVIDTLLLLSGIALVARYQLYPTQQPWLAAKLTALVAYIILGSLALRRGKTRAIRVCAFLSALAVFAYMLTVASTRAPFPLT